MPNSSLNISNLKNILSKFYILQSNAHISTPFFQKTVFFSKIFFGKAPKNFWRYV